MPVWLFGKTALQKEGSGTDLQMVLAEMRLEETSMERDGVEKKGRRMRVVMNRNEDIELAMVLERERERGVFGSVPLMGSL